MVKLATPKQWPGNACRPIQMSKTRFYKNDIMVIEEMVDGWVNNEQGSDAPLSQVSHGGAIHPNRAQYIKKVWMFEMSDDRQFYGGKLLGKFPHYHLHHTDLSTYLHCLEHLDIDYTFFSTNESHIPKTEGEGALILINENLMDDEDKDMFDQVNLDDIPLMLNSVDGDSGRGNYQKSSGYTDVSFTRKNVPHSIPKPAFR
mgnify:FL=1